MNASAQPAAPVRGHRGRPWLAHALTLLVVAAALTCLDHTRRTLSGTFDEPNHLAAGLEWWQFGSYRQWTENPPLARVAVAALPYAGGMRLPAPEHWDPGIAVGGHIWGVGSDLLYGGAGYEANLSLARLGTLPFYLLALAVVWALADGARRPFAGLVAVGLTSTLPAWIAHGALATTDVASAATLSLAALALRRWLDDATWERSVALGAALALALLAKFSALVLFPVITLAFVAARRLIRLPARPTRQGAALGPRALLRSLALVTLTLGLVTWAGYRFSLGRIDELPARVGPTSIVPAAVDRSALERLMLETPVPMPELFHGVLFLAAHVQAPPRAYLMGRISPDGFPWFYPLALAVKTPLPFMALALAGALGVARRWRAVPLWPATGLLLGAAGIVAISTTSRVNLGIRHVLVVLPLVAVASGRASEAWLAEASGRRRAARAALVASLVLGQLGVALGARSTELGYVNALAARDPGAVLLDSDLDWGQDLFALRREARARGIERLSIAYFGMLRLCEHGLPALQPLVPGRPTTGWLAISENFYRHRNYFGLLREPCDPDSGYSDEEVPSEPFAWLREHEPVALLGTSIRLYHVPETR